jgi:hypothetical protein
MSRTRGRLAPAAITSSTNSGTIQLSAVGYIRRSTDRQEQSIPDQKRAIERYAQERGWHIVRFYTDDCHQRHQQPPVGGPFSR